MMQQLSEIKQDHTQKVYDTKSGSMISISQGNIIVLLKNGVIQKWPLPEYESEVVPNYPKYLKFVKNNNNSIYLSPACTALVCKSERIQEVQMNQLFSKGIICWSIYVTQGTLGFSVGVKNSISKNSQQFEFSLKTSAKLTFKLDINNGIFKCWINGLQSQVKKSIELQKDGQWRPFVRIKQFGSTVLLNPFTSDPQQDYSQFNLLNQNKQRMQEQIKDIKEQQKYLFNSNYKDKKYNLLLIEQNKLLIQSNKTIKIIRRQFNELNFDFTLLHYNKEKEEIIILFKEQEIIYLKEISQKININIFGNILLYKYQQYYQIENNIIQWRNWFNKILNSLDLCYFKGYSKSILHKVYKIILSKLEQIKIYFKDQIKWNFTSQFDRLLTWGIDKAIFKQVNQCCCSFMIPSHIFLNNLPALNFAHQISTISLNHGEIESNFMMLNFASINRLCILNIEYYAFKVCEINLSKGYKKQNELNYYKNQVDNILNNNFNQPNIYKILKNCLKYADKIKPPENLIKQIQEKKAKKQSNKLEIEKKDNNINNKNKDQQVIPDKILQQTLISMGFNHRLARKVLIQCKNSSLETAIDLILNKYPNQNLKVETPINPPEEDWQCQACTLINKKNVFTCLVCDSPPPPNRVNIKKKQQIQMINKQYQEKKQQEIQGQVISQNIQSKLKYAYFWETGLGLCPVMIVGCFENLLRFRLIGPNPKYYSQFYQKQDGFLDVTSLKIYDYAYEINQQPIRSLKYLSCDTLEKKDNIFQWINIQDTDFICNENIIDIKFKTVQFNHQKLIFIVSIVIQNQNNNKIEKQIKGTIIIKNIFQEKKKCFYIEKNINQNLSENKLQNQMNINKNQMKISKKNDYQIQNCWEVPNQGQLQVIMCKKQLSSYGKEQVCENITVEINKKLQGLKNYLPLYVKHGSYGANLSYPGCQLTAIPNHLRNRKQQWKNGVVLRHLHHNNITLGSIILQKVKQGQARNGYIYVSNNLDLQPFRKYNFTFPKQLKKIFIPLNDNIVAKYIVIILLPEKDDDKYLNINVIGITGQSIQQQNNNNNNINNNENNVFRTDCFNDIKSIQLEGQKNGNMMKYTDYKVAIKIINANLDLSCVPKEKINEIILQMSKNIAIDLQISISLSDKTWEKVCLKSIAIQGWSINNIVGKYQFVREKKLSELEYKRLLENYLDSGAMQYLEQIVQPQYSQFRQMINQVQIQKFLLSFLMICPYNKTNKDKYSYFLKTFINHLHPQKINIKQILYKYLQSNDITAYGLELLFELIRIIPISSQYQLQYLQKILLEIKQKTIPKFKKNSLNQIFYQEQSIFSDYYHLQLQKQKIYTINNFSNSISQNCIMLKSNYSRKYIIDLMSIYKIHDLTLIFEKCDNINKFRLSISSLDNKNEQKLQKQQFYPEYIWNQLTKYQQYKNINNNNKNDLNSYDKIINKIQLKSGLNMLILHFEKIFQSRYIILELNFTSQPFIATQKQSNNIPQNQIIPEIFGDYKGQSSCKMLDIFNLNYQELIQMRKIANITKYQGNKNGRNIIYYQYQNIKINNQIVEKDIGSIMSKIHTDDGKDSYIRQMMKKPSKNNMNYLYTVSLMLVEDLLLHDKIDKNRFPKQLLELLVTVLINIQKGPLTQKAISLIRKVIKENNELALQLLKIKFSWQGHFIQVFKDINILENCKQKIIEILQCEEIKSNINIFQNICWLCKLKQECEQKLIQKLINISLQIQQFNEIINLICKFGWLGKIIKIIQYYQKQNNYNIIKEILKYNKNNINLIQYGQKLINQNQNIFLFIIEQLKNRIIKKQEIKIIIITLIKQINKLIFEYLEQKQIIFIKINDYFIEILHLSLKFGICSQIGCQIISLYFKIPNKYILINQLFQSKILQKQQCCQKLIQQCISLIDVHNIEINLSFINQLLLYILRKQISIENHIINQFKISIIVQQKIINVISNFLLYDLCFGGIENIKTINNQIMQKISIAFYMTALCTNEILWKQLEMKIIKKLIKWLLINLNTNQNNFKTIGILRFIKIQNKIWQIIINRCTGSNSQQFNKIFMQVLNDFITELSMIKNDTIRILYENKCFCFIEKIIMKFNKINKQLFHNLMNQYGLFKTILNIITKLSNIGNANNLKIQQKQLINTLKLMEEGDKPKDWLLYKNGAKNNVYTINYSKSTQQIKTITFESVNNFTLSQILIGFEYNYSNTKKVCIPKQIIIQGGLDLKKMRVIGKLFLIPDDYYMNYSVKIFGLNANLIKKSNQFIQNGCKNIPIKYLSLKIKSSEIVSISDALSTTFNVQNQNSSSFINFLSIQGYLQQDIHNQPHCIVNSIQYLSNVQHCSLIQNLFQQNQIIHAFKASLLNIALLMKHEIFEKVLHKFLMRIGQLNNEIGDQMLSKYLQIKNSYLCSKIATQLVLSNEQQIIERIKKYFNFLKQQLIKQSNNSNNNNIDNLLPFLDRFTQIVFITSYLHLKSNYSIIRLEFQQEIIMKLCKYNNRTQTQQKFLRTILTLSQPFEINGYNLSNILEYLFNNQNENNNNSNSNNKYLFASLIISNKQCRSWFMNHNYLENYFEIIYNEMNNNNNQNNNNQNNNNNININKVTDILFFLATLCQNSNIKNIINKSQNNLKIFEMFINKKYQLILSNNKNSKLRQSFVTFIAKSALGTQTQRIIGALLKDTLVAIVAQGNQSFVGQIFLPLLSSFNKVAISIIPYNSEQNRIIIDINNMHNFEQKIDKQKIIIQNSSSSSKFRLPTGMISQIEKQKLFQHIKQLNSYQCGNFNLISSHGSYTVGQVDNIKKLLQKNNKPFLMLFRTKSIQKNKKDIDKVIGIFYNKKDKTNINNLTWLKGSFIFLYEQNKQLSFINKQQNQSDIMINLVTSQIIHSDYSDFDEMIFDETEINLILKYNNKIYGQISYTYDNSSSFKWDILTINGKQQILQSAQYWILQPLEKLNNNLNNNEMKLTKNILQNINNINYFPNLYQANSQLKYNRYQKVYEFPSSITIGELKSAFKIMNCSIIQNKIKQFRIKELQNQFEINDTITLQQLFKKKIINTDDILNIQINLNQIIEILDLKKQKIINKQFLPRKGILKHFQENDGVTSMIKVIKKSIECWKNHLRKQKWIQYVTELQRFSSFPHFFGMYLKDEQTFNLLFNLLAGLPDKQTDPKWDQLESKSSQKLLKIVADILHVDKTTQFRQYAMKNDFFNTIVQRLRILTGQFKRQYIEDIKQQETNQDTIKNIIQDDGTKKVKKKKGVGYGQETNSNTKWMKGQHEITAKKQFQVISIILNMIENFLDIREWCIPQKLLHNIYQSALLPYIEDGLRAGTLLEISKYPDKFKLIFTILKTLSKHSQLIPILLPLKHNYQPKQTQSLYSLLKSLENTANIFLSCLQQNKSNNTNNTNNNDKISAQLANQIISTVHQVQQAVEQYNYQHNANSQENQMKNILELTIDKKYKILMKDLRFDYIDMKQGNNKIKHHYASSFNPNYTPNQNKMIRLAQQLADISTALPYEHTNGVYVRCDKDRVDFMQALIMGSNGTPYGHGAFLFDVYFDDNYPNGPPKVNLTTTGHGKVRFNPNLYACGKVCLSLLGTWRGSVSENWDSKVSTLLQVLLSIQAIIMSQDVYFNQPGFENQQGTQQGQKKNQAYSNIVRYCNIKFAMIDNMRNPPKGFETIIRRHFYLKKNSIMQECRKWQKYAQKRLANYVGLVNDHNNSWSTEFKKSKTQYKDMLEKAVNQLEQQFNKLSIPKISDIQTKVIKKKVKKDKQHNLLQKLQAKKLQQIDVTYENKDNKGAKEIDINDEKVKDRWSRYIGAMGIDAVSKQSKADILIYGLGPMALQVIKNVVLSGCKKLTICDDGIVQRQDLSGGFFYTESNIGKPRIQSIMYKIRQLNNYVKIDSIFKKDITQQIIKSYTIILVTEMNFQQQFKLNQICRTNGVKFLSADCNSVYCRLMNDFGNKFEVLDKNGQQPIQVIIKNISNDIKGVVTLIQGIKNPFEDNQAIIIRNIEGMLLKQDDKKSINGTIHKIKTINNKSFEIGDTTKFTPYIGNGTAKNIKTPLILQYKSLKNIFMNVEQNLKIDQNMCVYDFTKIDNNKLIHYAYLSVDKYKQLNKGLIPTSWKLQHAEQLLEIFKKQWKQPINNKICKFIKQFALTYQGYLPPLCAFFGGFVAQEIIKGITQKYKPVDNVFFTQFTQILPEIIQQQNHQKWNKQQLQKLKIKCQNNITRNKGSQIIFGYELQKLIQNCKLFMIGSGAIGCQLLKNFAMINLGIMGKITLTDPDHIENSNLNRQFLFRQKHISKPKSLTATASVCMMNPQLKNHISPLLEKVSDSTRNIFDNNFFNSLTLVANALDNVAARRYVDQRCVENKIPLFQSGTLGPKGHIQVIIPYLTQSYGSKKDPVQDGQIPHCTLKMFPQETLHCVEWSRDIFGKKFSLQPKALLKVLDKKYKPQKDDIKMLNECLVMVKKGPKNLDDCIAYAVMKFYKYFRDDIIQLLYTYPLNAKTKNGELFWKLPRRPPQPIKQLQPNNPIHNIFITSLAVLLAKIYDIPYPKTFRTQKQRINIAIQASKIKIPDFIPSDDKAKEIMKEQSAEQNKKNKEMQQKQQQQEQLTALFQQQNNKINEKDEIELYKEIKNLIDKNLQINCQQFEKDDDSNGHIDFIYSMANLRAINYKLENMDWINVKIKAGRIVPALATTTSCVAALQTIEICKYIKHIKINQMRNAFLNLAVPSLQMPEPGEVQKIKITDKLIVNLWDRWDVQCSNELTFKELFKKLQQKYEIYPIGIQQGMSRIDTAKNTKQKQQFLKCKILDKLEKQQGYIDIMVLFNKIQGDNKILQGIPTVRLIFKN